MVKIIAAALMVFGMVGGASAQAPSEADRSRSGSEKMMSCEQMMANMEAMQTQVKALENQLRQKVQQMNSAQGEAKIDATAAVVNQLATQHLKLYEMMTSISDQRMAHMMTHMGNAAGMQGCPMMKGMSSDAKNQ